MVAKRRAGSIKAELAVVREQQAATADILKAINASANDASPVFDIIVRNTTHLCDANFAFVMLHRNERLTLAARTDCTDEFADYLARGFPINRRTTTGRAALLRRPVQVLDFMADPEVGVTPAHRRENVRTVLAVPLVLDDRVLGVIATWRREVRPFSDNQIKLLETFASQAVIAIENCRLFEEIQDKRRQLEAANEARSRFLAAATHDLRQPLHALNLFVGQLQGESDPVERQRLVRQIDAAVSAMNELFGALLSISQLDAGLLERNLADFPVRDVLLRIEATFAETARSKGLRFHVVPSEAWVSTDFVLLERILLNLVANAIRYTSRGGIVLGCRRRGDRVRLEVWDTGIGIPKEEQRKIFGAFYRVAGAAPQSGGLGLGLSIVERLCILLDLPLEVRSAPGRGSRFSVSLRRMAGEQVVSPASVVEGSPFDRSAGKQILVIDNDALVLEGMRGILQSWGCRVVTAESASEAISRLEESSSRPDAIISDYLLAGGCTGVQAIERLRDVLGTAVPAVLMSGDTAPERLREAKTGGYRLLHKPVPAMALRAMLTELLQPKPTTTDVEANRASSPSGT